MVEALKAEIERIATRRFHVVDGPADSTLCQAIDSAQLFLPPSYIEFVKKCGNVKLYRRGYNRYSVEVYSPPAEVTAIDGGDYLLFGKVDSVRFCFSVSLLGRGVETPVFAMNSQGAVKPVQLSFERWLSDRCAKEKKSFTKSEWDAIEAGPKPFSSDELKIIEARRNFDVDIAGTTSSGAKLFFVKNRAKMVLPFLSVGIQARFRESDTEWLHGGVWLPVASIRPGESGTVEKDCYASLVLPETVEIALRPDPKPEDRDYYWEFRGLTEGRFVK